MTRFKRTVSVLGIAVILAFGLTLAGSGHGFGPTPALAVGCYAHTCEGYWPWDKGCQYDAYVVDQKSGSDFTVYLWYSSACNANWGTLQYPACSNYIHGVDITSRDGAYYPNSAPACYGNGWQGTDMVDGRYAAQACGERGTEIPACTGWW